MRKAVWCPRWPDSHERAAAVHAQEARRRRGPHRLIRHHHHQYGAVQGVLQQTFRLAVNPSGDQAAEIVAGGNSDRNDPRRERARSPFEGVAKSRSPISRRVARRRRSWEEQRPDSR